jgi:hypothetical protein
MVTRRNVTVLQLLPGREPGLRTTHNPSVAEPFSPAALCCAAGLGWQVAEDECRHFQLLERRLEETGSSYGALPAHDGLWESAWETGAHWLSWGGRRGGEL